MFERGSDSIKNETPKKALGDQRAGLALALDPNGLLIVDLIPELKFIIGAQAPVPMAIFGLEWPKGNTSAGIASL